MTDIFVSYKQTDRARVKLVAEALEAEGFSVWWDPEIPLGQTYYSAIERELAAAKVVMPVWTIESVSSEWVREEATKGKYQNKLLPVRLDDVEPPVGFSTIQTADLSNWSGERRDPSWRAVIAHASQLTGGQPAPPPSLKQTAQRNKNAFGGAMEPNAQPKKSRAWMPIAAVAGLAAIGLIALGAISAQNAPSPQPSPGPIYNSGPNGSPSANPDLAAAEAAAYNAALSVRNRSAYEAFLNLYPQSGYAQDVSKRLASCRMQRQAATSSMPVTATGWAAYAMGGCDAAQRTAYAYLQQGCLGYSQQGLVTGAQYAPTQTMDAMGNPVCLVSAQAACQFPEAASANYEVCQ